MILPNKFYTLNNSLLGVSSVLLLSLDEPKTINQLWNNLLRENQQITFEKFSLALDILFMFELINISNKYIRITENNDKKLEMDKTNLYEISKRNLCNSDLNNPIISYLTQLHEVSKNDTA